MAIVRAVRSRPSATTASRVAGAGLLAGRLGRERARRDHVVADHEHVRDAAPAQPRARAVHDHLIADRDLLARAIEHRAAIYAAHDGPAGMRSGHAPGEL